ncbi:hypothetical protein LAM01_02510 [Amylolactobacillus amylophilus]|nr:hypothetical protein LAM01_02510 [Amylolactobacillus amylophilus]
MVSTISSLSNVIKKNANSTAAIKHYLNNHGHIPLWVLVNFLTFGEINHFYSNLVDNLQIKIATEFSRERSREWSSENKIRITPETIKTVNHLVNLFRNSVAHGEITYSRKIAKSPKTTPIRIALNMDKSVFSSQAGVFELILSLKVMLPKKYYIKLSHELINLLSQYKNKFQSIDFSSILQDMNFPNNYQEYI